MQIITFRSVKNLLPKPPAILMVIQFLCPPFLNYVQDCDHITSSLTTNRMPLSFEANREQADSQVRYLSRGNDFSLFLAPSETVLAIRKPAKGFQSVLWMQLVRAHPDALVEGHSQLYGNSNYFISNNRKEKMMDKHDEIIADLMRLRRWQYIAFAAACAERVALVFRSLGRPESVALYEQALETAWMAVDREDLIPQARQLIKKLENTPEADVDDSALPEFDAMTAMSILSYALEAVAMKDLERAKWACNTALGLREALDFELTEESKRITRIDPNNPPPPGPLEVLELEHQRQSLELIKSVQEPNAELISSLRRLSQDANKELESAVSELRKQKGR